MSKINRKNLSLIFLSIILITLVIIYLGVTKATYAYQENSDLSKYVLNPLWVEYSSLSLKEQAKYEVVPEKFIYQYKNQNNSKISLFRTEEEYPEYYNLNDDNFSTPPDYQGSLGICWSFAAMSSMETYLLKNGTSNIKNPIKFSTRQLDYASVNKEYITENFNPYQMAERAYPGSGARLNTAFILMSSGISPVTTEKFADSITDTGKKSIGEVINLDNVEYTVDSYVNYGVIGDYSTEEERESWIKAIKDHLFNYGSVTISVKGSSPYSAGSCIHVNEDKTNFLVNQNGDCNESGDGGHAMSIIGYDDNYTYKYCRLSSTTTSDLTNCENVVSGKGAFILKNSWGESYPYPYLAYTSNVNGSYGVTGVSKKDWDTNYDTTKENEGNYDAGISKITYYKSENIPSQLKKISFYSNKEETTDYKVYISQDGSEEYNLLDTISTNKVGLVSLKVKENIFLNKNKFSIKITSTNGYVDKIYAFTKNITETSNLKIDTVIKNQEEYEMNTTALSIYSVTENIPNGEKIEYQLLDSTGKDITNILNVDKNYNLNHQVKPNIQIKSTLPSGTLTLKTIYNNQELDSDTIKVNELKNLWSGGSGTVDDPYLINNVEDFKKIFTSEEYLKVNYKLTNDLDFSKIENWNAGEVSNYQAFSGTLDGDNHMILGLQANSSIPSIFYSLNNATIKNLIFSESNLNLKESGWGNLVSIMAYDSNIENIVITKTVKITGNASYAGGLIGTAYNTTFTKIANYADIKTTYEYEGKASGIVNIGYAITLNECYNYGNITVAKSVAGGLVAILKSDNTSDSLIKNSYNLGKIVSSIKGGGIVGEGENSIIENTYNVFSEKVEDNIGNIIGSSSYMGIKNTFYLNTYSKLLVEDIDNSTTKINVYGKTQEELQEQNTYLNFDFDYIWKIENNDYPSLRNLNYTYLTSIELDEKINLEIGEEKELSLSFIPTTASNKKVKYEILNDDIMRIDENHHLTALKKGTTTLKIYALDGSGITKEIQVNIQSDEIDLDDYQIIENTYLKIEENTSPEIFKNNIYRGEKYKINLSSQNPYIATGDKISILNENNTLIQEYTAIVLGDITGDGTVDVGDVAKLYQYVRKKFTMEREFILAGDVYSDSQLKINDVAKLYQYIKKNIPTLEES